MKKTTQILTFSLLMLISFMPSVTVCDNDINTQVNENQNTPLIIAVENYDVNAVQLLIDLDANLEIKNENGYTALIMAVENHVELLYEVALLMTFNEQDSSDYSETKNCIASSIEIIQLLLRSGADVSAQDEDGDTVLQYLNRTIDEVNETFDDYDFDKEIDSFYLFGFEICSFATKDLHTALIELKDNLEELKQVIEKSITL